MKDEYEGFDVRKDKRWSALWSKVPHLNHKKYGNLKYWETITLPRILTHYNATNIEDVIERTHKENTYLEHLKTKVCNPKYLSILFLG